MATAQITADWSTSYSRYLTQSAALSARTLKLYQEALEQVSVGKLPATIFQDHLPRFAQAYAAEFSLQLAETGARFMTHLMHVGASFGQRASLDGEEPELAPPRFDPHNPARWYEQLADYAGQLNARALRVYRAQLDRVARGEMTPSEVQQSASEQLAQRVPEYLQRLTQIYFDLLNGLNDIRAKYEEAYFRGVLAQAGDEDTDGPVVLSLFGVCGTTVSGSLAVTNTTPKRASISYRVTELRRADGIGPAFVPKLTILPEQPVLSSGEEAMVSLAVQLDAETFETDVPYVGAFNITGGPDLQVEVQLRIVATEHLPNSAEAAQ